MTDSKNNCFYLLLLVVILVVYTLCWCKYFNGDAGDEDFTMDPGESSAWGYNTGPGYGAGYGTGYSMWGIWPSMVYGVPWKNWMWGRRPTYFETPHAPTPQIDYNNAPALSYPVQKYTIELVSVGPEGTPTLAVNGKPTRVLQFDRDRVYDFQIYTPGGKFTISDGKSNIIEPTENGIVSVKFTENTPDKIYFGILGTTQSGIIYLNNIRGAKYRDPGQ